MELKPALSERSKQINMKKTDCDVFLSERANREKETKERGGENMSPPRVVSLSSPPFPIFRVCESLGL